MRNQEIDTKAAAGKKKIYVRPGLTKGPALAHITAAVKNSGIVQ